MDVVSQLAHGSRAGLPLDVLAALTLLAAVPFLLVMTTSFVRIVVVLSLVRSAIGAASLPPNAVLSGLALAALVRHHDADDGAHLARSAVEPYAAGRLSQPQMACSAGSCRCTTSCCRQTHRRDLELCSRASAARAATPPRRRVDAVALAPAFVVGELRSAFAIGFALYLPFVAIDLAVASILMGLGMFMLSPPIISLPCKLLLFVMVDGWALVCEGVVSTFR